LLGAISAVRDGKAYCTSRSILRRQEHVGGCARSNVKDARPVAGSVEPDPCGDAEIVQAADKSAWEADILAGTVQADRLSDLTGGVSATRDGSIGGAGSTVIGIPVKCVAVNWVLLRWLRGVCSGARRCWDTALAGGNDKVSVSRNRASKVRGTICVDGKFLDAWCAAHITPIGRQIVSMVNDPVFGPIERFEEVVMSRPVGAIALLEDRVGIFGPRAGAQWIGAGELQLAQLVVGTPAGAGRVNDVSGTVALEGHRAFGHISILDFP